MESDCEILQSMTSRRAQAQSSIGMRNRVCIALAALSCALASACEVHESAFERRDPVTLERGRAVSEWDAALRLESQTDAPLADAAQSEPAADGGDASTADARDEDAA